MRILLIGEFSRLHNSLKEGLTALGHEVTLVGNRDGFKNYPVDIYINHSFQNKFLKKLRTLIFKLTSVDLGSIEVYFKILRKFKLLKGYDVVQLITETSFKLQPNCEKKVIEKLLKNNNKLFLLSCSYDHQCVSYMLERRFKYCALTPYLEDPSLHKEFQFQLQFMDKNHTALHDYIYKNSNGIIATDIDYHIPLLGNEKYLGLIPNPINTDLIKYIPLDFRDKIKIFHGVNTLSALKKGNHFFVEALKLIEDKYSDKVEIVTTYNIPYNDYIKLYNECHIFLDMVYAYDQGYNALEAMAKGKVVFTGAEKEWLEHYSLEEDTVVINAEPDAHKIAKKLEWLINNPKIIEEISLNARAFIEREHNYITIAEKYINTYLS